MKHGYASRGRKPPEYIAWCAIKGRCLNPKNKDFKFYGGRGIKMCARWRDSFINFLIDVGPRPSHKHRLSRYPNKKGDYKSGNVCWVKTQKRKIPYQQSPERRFNMQRTNAKQRGIKWQLMFDQWWKIWDQSEKWKKRGRKKGQYCMARNKDRGTYAIGNVSIISSSKNSKDRKPYIRDQKWRRNQAQRMYGNTLGGK